MCTREIIHSKAMRSAILGNRHKQRSITIDWLGVAETRALKLDLGVKKWRNQKSIFGILVYIFYRYQNCKNHVGRIGTLRKNTLTLSNNFAQHPCKTLEMFSPNDLLTFSNFTGFPGDKDPESLWISKCRALLVTSGLIWNDCDVKRGSSGSGVLAKDNSSGSPRTVVVGVLSGDRSLVLIQNGRTRKVRLNVAVHLTGPKLSQINEWTNGWAPNSPPLYKKKK